MRRDSLALVKAVNSRVPTSKTASGGSNDNDNKESKRAAGTSLLNLPPQLKQVSLNWYETRDRAIVCFEWVLTESLWRRDRRWKKKWSLIYGTFGWVRRRFTWKTAKVNPLSAADDFENLSCFCCERGLTFNHSIMSREAYFSKEFVKYALACAKCSMQEEEKFLLKYSCRDLAGIERFIFAITGDARWTLSGT